MTTCRCAAIAPGLHADMYTQRGRAWAAGQPYGIQANTNARRCSGTRPRLCNRSVGCLTRDDPCARPPSRPPVRCRAGRGGGGGGGRGAHLGGPELLRLQAGCRRGRRLRPRLLRLVAQRRQRPHQLQQGLGRHGGQERAGLRDGAGRCGTRSRNTGRRGGGVGGPLPRSSRGVNGGLRGRRS